MVTQLIIVWVLGVAAFFALWALIAWIFRKISDRKSSSQGNDDDEEPTQEKADNPLQKTK